ncbi:MAG: Dihydrolipoamide acetyltransferase component (E2) of acetoin dehydrogenase complex [Nitrospira sp.]|jgi:pyruvate dehydrogenase E2 component (dihydrolipoamide acetyltransferase)|nr:MAG: Dihydrolipoamide acetyltransferase component (E2) of acetoin dehydrogenase complex [Nitrospira sp.]
MAEFVMPTLGSDMTEGTLVEWKKKVGDRVIKGEIIAEVDTEKSAIEVESFHTGVIQQLITQPGDTVPVGTVMAVIREEGKPIEQVETKPEAEPVKQPPPSRVTEPIVSPPSEPGRLRISPAAKQLVAELHVDPSMLKGTGPGGAITLDDVHAAAAMPTNEPSLVAIDRQTRMRETIAAAMARSKREIPHYYLSTTIDLGRAMAWLKAENLKRPVTDRLLYGVLLIKAVALALRQVPELNAVRKEGAVVQIPDIHIGIAVSLRQGGLVAPAIHHTDKQSLGELMTRFQDLVKRARTGTLRSSEFSDPTITVTSLGEQGVETVFGVIYPPQVALVGFGKVVERPWVIEGQVVSRPVVTASLSADHRVTDGHRGGIFLSVVDRLLQEPGAL